MAKVNLKNPRKRHFGFRVGNVSYVYRGKPLVVDDAHAKLLCDPKYGQGQEASGLGLEWVEVKPVKASKPTTKKEAVE